MVEMPTLLEHNKAREAIFAAREENPGLAGVLCACKKPMIIAGFTRPTEPASVKVHCPACKSGGWMLL